MSPAETFRQAEANGHLRQLEQAKRYDSTALTEQNCILNNEGGYKDAAASGGPSVRVSKRRQKTQEA